jgi:ATP synthase subunit 6
MGIGKSKNDSSLHLFVDETIHDKTTYISKRDRQPNEKFEKLNLHTVEYVYKGFQIFTEMLYVAVLGILKSNIKNSRGIKFFPLVFFVFFTVLSLNLIGLIPYSFTVTSHIIITLGFSLSIFIGIVIVAIKKHGLNFLLLFKPSGISLGLLFLLIPIEFISFLVKPISLAIRLFANMMAGHTLLKVIAGFAFTLSTKSGILFVLHLVPLAVIVPLYGLEFAVALIQSFVFATLMSIYINEALELH